MTFYVEGEYPDGSLAKFGPFDTKEEAEAVANYIREIRSILERSIMKLNQEITDDKARLAELGVKEDTE